MLVDATVLITGASSGIGAACARAFAEKGARLILCARREGRLRELADTLDTETHVLPLDVRDRAAVQANIALLGPSWSQIDVLVNNAGLAAGVETVLEGDPNDWDRILQTNVSGLLEITRAVVGHMVQRGSGHVINIGSVAGREPAPNNVVYSASKAAVGQITRGLRMELLGTGVRVSAVDPGLVETEFSVVRHHGDADRAHETYRGITPLTADDVAEAVVWVADRPRHVQVAEVLILPTDQATLTMVNRQSSPPSAG